MTPGLTTISQRGPSLSTTSRPPSSVIDGSRSAAASTSSGAGNRGCHSLSVFAGMCSSTVRADMAAGRKGPCPPAGGASVTSSWPARPAACPGRQPSARPGRPGPAGRCRSVAAPPRTGLSTVPICAPSRAQPPIVGRVAPRCPCRRSRRRTTPARSPARPAGLTSGLIRGRSDRVDRVQPEYECPAQSPTRTPSDPPTRPLKASAYPREAGLRDGRASAARPWSVRCGSPSTSQGLPRGEASTTCGRWTSSSVRAERRRRHHR